jgi:hypothetical protein
MSAIGTKRTSLVALHMSAFGGKADIDQAYVLAPQNFTPRKYGCGLADRRRWRQAVGGPLVGGGELEHVAAIVLARNLFGPLGQLMRPLAKHSNAATKHRRVGPGVALGAVFRAIPYSQLALCIGGHFATGIATGRLSTG